MQNLYFFLTIVNRSDDKEFLSFFERCEINNIYSMPARGTAADATLDLLGLARSEKTVHVSLLSQSHMKSVIGGLTREMLIDIPGRGIALAVPLSSIGSRAALDYFGGGHTRIHEKFAPESGESEEKKMENTELIVVICERGHTDAVMDAAREAGARGGTVIHAKGTGSQYAKFFGLSIAEEKEMIYIVSTTEKKAPIMKAIMDRSNADPEAHTITFSLPVTDTAGLRLSANE